MNTEKAKEFSREVLPMTEDQPMKSICLVGESLYKHMEAYLQHRLEEITEEMIKEYAKKQSATGSPYKQYDSIQTGAKWVLKKLKDES